MKKTIITALISLAFATTAFAATPTMDIAAGTAQIGYSYNNLQTNAGGFGDLGTYHANEFQLTYGLSNKLAITGDYLKSDSHSFNVYNNGVYTGSINGLNYDTTKIGLQYQLSNNIALLAGNVKSDLNWNSGSTSSSEMYGGVAYKGAITNNLDGYASYLKSTNMQDWKAGVTYGLSKNTSVDVGYRHYENNGSGLVKAEGITIGANYKF